jgi:hypothetical protein
MEEVKLTTKTDSETGWPMLIRETKNTHNVFRLDPSSSHYFRLSSIYPKGWTEVSAEETPAIEAEFRKAYASARP